MPTSSSGETLVGWLGLGSGILLVYSAVKNKPALQLAQSTIQSGTLPGPAGPSGSGSVPTHQAIGPDGKPLVDSKGQPVILGPDNKPFVPSTPTSAPYASRPSITDLIRTGVTREIAPSLPQLPAAFNWIKGVLGF